MWECSLRRSHEVVMDPAIRVLFQYERVGVWCVFRSGGLVGRGCGGVCCVLLLAWVGAVECLVVVLVWVGVLRRPRVGAWVGVRECVLGSGGH